MNLPICDKCNKPVDLLEVYYSPKKMESYFTVYCHGEIESAILSDEMFMSAISILPGRAFRKKKPKYILPFSKRPGFI